MHTWLWGDGSKPAPPPLLDVRFIPLGKTYLPELSRAYAAAWNEGAKALESGQPVTAALKSVRQSWDSGQVQLFDRLVTPEFSKFVGARWRLFPGSYPCCGRGGPRGRRGARG
ncbi:MAG: hypothetical protein WA746_11705 [Isosphaeraceae bacterium]